MVMRFLDRFSRSLHLPTEARKLAKLAFILWLVSLCLPGFATYGKSGVSFGAQILLMGWLWPSAWYANPFLLFALSKLRQPDKVPVISTTLATLIACTIYFFDALPNPETGDSPLYGFGLGAAIWFAAIAVTIIAVGTRIEEIRTSRTDAAIDASAEVFTGHGWRRFGLLLLVLISIGGSSWIAWNLTWAEPVEYKYLLYAPFKRGLVWHVALPMPSQQIDLQGPLEVRYDGNSQASLPDKLLAWGIPVVRMNGWDYSLSYPAGQRVVSGIPAKGEPGAILELDESSKYGVRLIDATQSRVLIDHQWKISYRWERETHWPAGYGPLRDTITQALNIHPTQAELERLASQQVKPQRFKEPEVVSLNPEAVSANRCPSGIKALPREEASRVHKEWIFMGKPLRVNERVYFGRSGGVSNWAFCEGGIVYILTNTVLEKRALDDFRLIWSVDFLRSGGPWPGVPGKSKALAVRETSEALFVDYWDFEDGQRYTAKAPLPEPLPGTDYPIVFQPPEIPAETEGASLESVSETVVDQDAPPPISKSPSVMATPPMTEQTETVLPESIESSPFSADAQLHVLGVYRAAAPKSERPWWKDCDNHQDRRNCRPPKSQVINVHVMPGKKPLILAMMGYETVKWRIQNPSQRPIKSVILSGYHPQEVYGLTPDIPIQSFSYEARSEGDYFYAYRRDDAEYSKAIASLEKLTGKEPSNVQLAHYALDFTIR